MKAWHYFLLFVFLVAIALIPLWIAAPVDWGDFWTNVSTELIGAAVTAAVVTFIVSRIETQRSIEDQKEVERSLGELAFEFANQVSELLGIRELPGTMKALDYKTITGLAEHTIGLMLDEIAAAVRGLSDSKLVSLAEYIGSIERLWQAFYNRHSSQLAQEYSAEMLRLSKEIDSLKGSVLMLSRVEAEADRNFQGDPNDELDVFSHRSQIHEEQSLHSSLLAYDQLILLMACVRLAIRTEHIASHLWSTADLDSLMDETRQESEKALEEYMN